MADNKKIYTIQINGIDQSIKQVDALSDALQYLDKKIKELESRSVSITSSSSGGGGGSSDRASQLQTEDKLLKQIQSTEQQIRDARREDYQGLLAQKDILKETKDVQEQRAAAERLASVEYGNTMKGLKQELSDIKKVMQTTELGSAEFDDLTKRAGVLTNKLKSLEQEYGQFGRNVGNYAEGVAKGIIDANKETFDSMRKVTVNINGMEVEFENLEQAAGDMEDALKAMHREGKQGTEEYQQMADAVHKLQMELKASDEEFERLRTASPALTSMLHTMQGMAAVGSVAEGFSALFGFDDSEIQKSIQKLVALQSIMQGISEINEQINSKQGIGAWLAKGNAAIDKFSASLLGVSNNAKAANAGLKTTAAATTAVGTASKAATIAVKALSLALKTIGIGLVITAIAYLTEAITDWLSKESEAEKAAKRMAEVNQAGAKAYANAAGEMQAYKTKLDNFNGSKKQEKALVDELNNKYGKALGNYKSLKEWKDVIINKSDAYCTALLKEAEAQALLNQYTEAFVELQTVRDNAASGEYHHWWRTAAGNAAADAEEISKAEKNAEQAMNRYKAKMQEINQYNKTHKLFDFSNYADTKDIKNSGAKIGKTIKDVEADLAKARVDAMKQGLTKTLAQLELERNKRIAEAKKTGKLVQEQIKLINKQYQDKVFEARVQYHTNLINDENKYVEKVEKLNEEMYQKEVEISRKRNELRKADKAGNAVDLSNDFQVNTLTIDYNSSDVRKYIDQYGKDALKAYTNTKNTVEYLQNFFGKISDSYEQLSEEAQIVYDKYSLMLDEAKEQLKVIEDENEGISEVVKNIGILSERTSEAYALRTQRRREYYETLLEISKEAADKELVIEKEKLDTEYHLLEQNEEKRHKLAISRYYDEDISSDDKKKYKTPRIAQETYMEEYDNGNLNGKATNQIGTYFSEYRKLMGEWLNDLKEGVQEGEYTWEEYNEFMNQEAIKGYLKAKTEYENFLLEYNAMSANEKAQNEEQLKEYTGNLNNAYVGYLDNIRAEQEIHDNQMKIIKNQHDNEIKEAERNNLKERQAAYTEYYSNLLSDTENVLSSVNNKIDKAEKRNAWDIINHSATKKELKDLEDTITIALDDIAFQKEQLLERLKEGKISFGDYDTLISQLKVIETQSQDTAKNVSTKLKDLTREWWGSIDKWVQEVGQTMNTILSSFSEIQSNQYDKMIEQQEKYIEEYENMLDKQKDITQEHASAVESIEDELSTARGDRRQQLIDQLNAEMAAQRASLAQEQKIEREREKAEEKKKKLEHDQAVAKKKMQLAQAAINMAMSISMAAVNSWPIPAIPMMALAASAGAAQIAAIQSQNIPSYGSGGVIQGKSHREGGVKVLGGQAEVEGGEFITNKVTTSKNVDLLEYINTKRRKIKLEDLIDFYGGNSQVKKSITTVRTKFADGGMIPTLRNDINLNDRLLTAFEDYSNRPQVVSVVEIVDKMQTVREIQTMAGLETNY